MNIKNAIISRKSVRKYSDEAVDKLMLNRIQQSLNNYIPLFSETKVRFQVIDSCEQTKKAKIGFLFGKINAPCCIVGICEDDKKGMLELGFAIEQEVLKLTDEGYGTCWLGTFNREVISKICGIKENEKPGIVIAVGKAKENVFMNNGFRKIAGSTKRKNPDEVCIDSLNKTESSIINEILKLSILAPSANNNQPVRVNIDENKADFFLVNDSTIDAGIFISHFYLCAKEYFNDVKIIIENSLEKTNEKGHNYIATIIFS